MLIRIPRGWEMPAREATPEDLSYGRRRLLQGLTAAAGTLLVRTAEPQAPDAAPTAPPNALSSARNTHYDVEMGPLTSRWEMQLRRTIQRRNSRISCSSHAYSVTSSWGTRALLPSRGSEGRRMRTSARTAPPIPP